MGCVRGDLWMFTFLNRLARKGLRAFDNDWKGDRVRDADIGENSLFCGLTP